MSFPGNSPAMDAMALNPSKLISSPWVTWPAAGRSESSIPCKEPGLNCADILAEDIKNQKWQ